MIYSYDTIYENYNPVIMPDYYFTLKDLCSFFALIFECCFSLLNAFLSLMLIKNNKISRRLRLVHLEGRV